MCAKIAQWLYSRLQVERKTAILAHWRNEDGVALTRLFTKSLRKLAHIPVFVAAFATATVISQVAQAETSSSSYRVYSTSLSGNYLAGRYAGNIRENRAAAEFYARALAEDPENPFILERAFLFEVSAGNLSRASQLAIKVLKRDSRHRIAHVILGLKHFGLGRYGRARAHFTSSSQGPIGELTSSLLLAWSNQADGRSKEAIAALDVLAKTESFGVFRSYHAALIHDLADEKEQARKLYRETYDAATSSLRVVQAYGSFLERNGQAPEAATLYKTFLDSSPEHPLILEAKRRAEAGESADRVVDGARAGIGEALFGIASALTDESSIDVALIYVRMTLDAHPDLVIAQTLLGDIYEDIKQYEQAITAYEEVPKSSPLRKNADIQIASNLNRLDRHDEARKRLEEIIAKYPGDRRPVVVLANILRGSKKFAEAAEIYTKAIALTPDPRKQDWTLFYFRGICYERSKVWPKAEVDFKKALTLYPDQPLVLNYLGYSWVEKGLHLQDAMSKIRKAVELRKNDGYIVDSLGWAHYQLREFEEAVKHLERAVELRPDDPVINDHLGDAYWRVGRKLEARFQWSHAKALKPEPDDLKKIILKLATGMEPIEDNKATSSSETPDKI